MNPSHWLYLEGFVGGLVWAYAIFKWWKLGQLWLSRRRARRVWANRPRGQIIQVGRVHYDEIGGLHITDFIFDPLTSSGAFAPINSFGPDGEWATVGYTADELVEIAGRAKEFGQVPSP